MFEHIPKINIGCMNGCMAKKICRERGKKADVPGRPRGERAYCRLPTHFLVSDPPQGLSLPPSPWTQHPVSPFSFTHTTSSLVLTPSLNLFLLQEPTQNSSLWKHFWMTFHSMNLQLANVCLLYTIRYFIIWKQIFNIWKDHRL